jgi:SAM-dependent methyltransferase
LIEGKRGETKMQVIDGQSGMSDEGKKINQHPWKLSREECVLNVLKKRRNLHNFADIGVSDMFYTRKIKTFADGNVYAVDLFFPEEGIIKDGIICINNIEKLPENKLDCLIMMDVLEHVQDDNQFFGSAVNKLKDGGTILITVPAWPFLFSVHDVNMHHYRRYNRKQLIDLLKHERIKIERCHYFYTSLFFVRLVFMLKKEKFSGNESMWKYSEKFLLTIVIKLILNIDFWINKILDKVFIRLPGLSLFAICRKTENKK